MKILFRSLMAISLCCATACESFLDVDPPNSKIPASQVFANDITATTAVIGIYDDLKLATSFAAGGTNSIVSLAGLSADELHNNVGTNQTVLAFQNNALFADNTSIFSLWSNVYKVIYDANAVLEGLSRSSEVTPETYDQLRGEALFVRAFSNFYLVNCFGDAPLILTTDYRINALAHRAPLEDVYDQIESDLLECEDLLTNNYVTAGRVRVNKFTATAMLARVYLYRKDWQRAEDKSTNVIAHTELYNLPEDLNSVFVDNSTEAIWQLYSQSGKTVEGQTFGISEGGLLNNVLNSEVVDEFEENDKRKANWITSITSGDKTTWLPYKYKGIESNLHQYATILRLAEQYLIRAEARAMQNKLFGVNSATSDVNMIRFRAGLLATTATNQDDLLSAIRKERRLELLVEWGHRWLDLKRWDLANTVLDPIKEDWQSSDQLYPLPAQELRNNPRLAPQNPGY